MEYPAERDITDPMATLPREVADGLAPLVEKAQRRYRRFRQTPGDYTEKKELEIILDHTKEIFQPLALQELKSPRGTFEEYCAKIGLETGAADTAFRFAHWLYKCVQRGRMLGTWHRQVQDHLVGLIRDAEDLWWNPDVVPQGWDEVFDNNPELVTGLRAAASDAGWAAPKPEPSRTGRRAPEEFFNDYRAKNPGMTYDQIAGRIGISRDVLFKIKDETGWVRDVGYESAAKFLDCRPEDLRPRNLPKPPRRKRTRRKRPATSSSSSSPKTNSNSSPKTQT